jgi:hypothetical protein
VYVLYAVTTSEPLPTAAQSAAQARKVHAGAEIELAGSGLERLECLVFTVYGAFTVEEKAAGGAIEARSLRAVWIRRSRVPPVF